MNELIIKAAKDAKRRATIESEENLLEELIESSKYILDLQENFDDDDSEKYSLQVWEKVTSFLSRIVKDLIPLPEILPGPNGSIDLHWKADNFELLINIPKGNNLAEFYCDNYKELSIKGTFNLEIS